MKISDTLRERFFAKLKPLSNGCIEWTAGTNADGYGRMKVGWADDGTPLKKLAHHVSWYIKHKRWPELLMHTCDNPRCVCLSHLVEGTHQANVADMVAKGRQAKGVRVASYKGIKEQCDAAGISLMTYYLRKRQGKTDLFAPRYQGQRKPYEWH
jgi:hypothetical protein